jgi:predicted enzyme related to lactoylglutathione lyase
VFIARIRMENSISLANLMVRDYDEAIAFYTKAVGFRVVSDETIASGKRFVVISPSHAANATGLSLAKASSERELAALGNQCGGKVAFFMKTSDFDAQYVHMHAAGVKFVEEPRDEPYGKVVVWEDLYGNKWDLIQHK